MQTLNTVEATIAEVEREATINALIHDYTQAAIDYAAAGRPDLLYACQVVVAHLQAAQEVTADVHYFLNRTPGKGENAVT